MIIFGFVLFGLIGLVVVVWWNKALERKNIFSKYLTEKHNLIGSGSELKVKEEYKDSMFAKFLAIIYSFIGYFAMMFILLAIIVIIFSILGAISQSM